MRVQWRSSSAFHRFQERWVDNIRMDLQEVGCGYMDWIGLAQDRESWRSLVSAVMNLRVPWNVRNFLTSCKPVSFSRRTLHHGVSKLYGNLRHVNLFSDRLSLLSWSCGRKFFLQDMTNHLPPVIPVWEVPLKSVFGKWLVSKRTTTKRPLVLVRSNSFARLQPVSWPTPATEWTVADSSNSVQKHFHIS